MSSSQLKEFLEKAGISPTTVTLDSLTEAFQKLPDKDLIGLFDNCYKDTKKSFCSRMKFDYVGFSRFCKGNNPQHYKSRLMISNYLANYVLGHAGSIRSSIIAPQIVPQLNFALDWQNLLPTLINSKAVILIDADQTTGQLQTLQYLFDFQSISNKTEPEIRVLAFHGITSTLTHWQTLTSSWCTWIGAPSRGKEAADVCMIMALYSLNKIMPATVPFIICSNDYFASTGADVISSFSNHRFCKAISRTKLPLILSVVTYISHLLAPSEFVKRSISYINLRREQLQNKYRWSEDQCLSFLAEIFFHRSDITLDIQTVRLFDELIRQTDDPVTKNETSTVNKTSVSEDKVLADDPTLIEIRDFIGRRESISLGEIGNRWPLTPELANKFSCSKWSELLKQPRVLTFLNATIEKPCHGAAMLVTQPPFDSRTEESYYLLNSFYLFWTGDSKEFCLKYKIAQEDFELFLNGKRPNHLDSCAAIRQYLEEMSII